MKSRVPNIRSSTPRIPLKVPPRADEASGARPVVLLNKLICAPTLMPGWAEKDKSHASAMHRAKATVLMGLLEASAVFWLNGSIAIDLCDNRLCILDREHFIRSF